MTISRGAAWMIAGGLAVGTALSSTPALAQANSFDAALTGGAYAYGGDTNEHFSITDGAFAGNAIQLGLRAQIRGAGATITPIGTIYNIATGGAATIPGGFPANLASWNFDFSIFASAGLASLAGATLTITDTTAGTPSAIIPVYLGATTPIFGTITDNVLLGGSGEQNSENLAFFNPLFNPDAAHSYDITLTVQSGLAFISDTITVNAVPEPASMALLGVGLAGLVAARRKRRA